ncbi:MAG: hypothetical protein IPF98_03980 [Gemmatimonadetes bacterium]|nr:hypothetical protein [Gemmatimonadota bacterium]
MAKTIDDQFRNSPAPTKTGTEQSFSAGFMTMFGNIQLLTDFVPAYRQRRCRSFRHCGGRVKIPLIYNVAASCSAPYRRPSRRSASAWWSPSSLPCAASQRLHDRAGQDRRRRQRLRRAPGRRLGDVERRSGADVNIIGSFPHVALGSDGKPLVSPETYIVMNLQRRGADSVGLANVVIRGVSLRAFEVRKNITIEGAPLPAGRAKSALATRSSRAKEYSDRRQAALRGTRLDRRLPLLSGRLELRVRGLGARSSSSRA